MTKTITSRHNLEIKTVMALQNAKERKANQQFIAEGLRTIATLLEHKIRLVNLYVTGPLLDQAEKLVSDPSYITLVTNDVMAKISSSSTPSGILAVFTLPYPPQPQTLSRGIVLAQIADPGNMGTLIRSCAAMGFSSVVIIEGTDPWSPKVVQSSAGAVGQVSIFSWTWEELVANKGSLELCALVVNGGKQPEKIDTKKTLLVVGNEAKGLPQQWVDQCDERMTIPMPGNTESLNAAVAGSIALYMVAQTPWQHR